MKERKVLVQFLINWGWFDAARDAVTEPLAITPNDGDTQAWLTTIVRAQGEVAPTLQKHHKNLRWSGTPPVLLTSLVRISKK